MKALLFYSAIRNTESFLYRFQDHPIDFILIPLPEKKTEAYQIRENLIKEYDNITETFFCAVVLGGDGSCLSVLKIMQGLSIPTFHVNFGRLGFFSYFHIDNILSSLDKYLQSPDTFRVQLLYPMKIELKNMPSPFYTVAFNDIRLFGLPYSHLHPIQVDLLEEAGNFYFEAQGLYLSTPLGSTGFHLTQNSFFIHWDVPALWIQILGNTIQSSFPGMLIPASETVRILPPPHAMLDIDGYPLPLAEDECITISLDKTASGLVVPKHSNLYKKVQDSFYPR